MTAPWRVHQEGRTDRRRFVVRATFATREEAERAATTLNAMEMGAASAPATKADPSVRSS